MSDFRPYPPEDFESFWRETTEEALAAPLDYHRSWANDYPADDHVVEKIEFHGIRGRRRFGWIAYPNEARRLPAFLWIPPYGRESKLPDAYGTRVGFVSMSFNFFGLGAFHQEKYAPGIGYFAEGADDPTTWIFREMFQDSVIATRVLQAQPEADEDRLATMGMSQGGGMSIWNAAWNPLIRAACADMPFLGAMGETLSKTIFRYPLKELVDYMEQIPVGQERIRHTVSYFDTMNQAAFAKVPVHVSRGLRDPASRPDNVGAIYDALPVEKELLSLDWGHDWHPDMITSNEQWMRRHLG